MSRVVISLHVMSLRLCVHTGRRVTYSQYATVTCVKNVVYTVVNTARDTRGRCGMQKIYLISTRRSRQSCCL